MHVQQQGTVLGPRERRYSPCSFLRLRAVAVLGEFSEVPFADGALLPRIVHRVIEMISDAEIAVRVRAASSLRAFLVNEALHDVIAPLLPAVLEAFFQVCVCVCAPDGDCVCVCVGPRAGPQHSGGGCGLMMRPDDVA